jgi:hypothetical protein
MINFDECEQKPEETLWCLFAVDRIITGVNLHCTPPHFHWEWGPTLTKLHPMHGLTDQGPVSGKLGYLIQLRRTFYCGATPRTKHISTPTTNPAWSVWREAAVVAMVTDTENVCETGKCTWRSCLIQCASFHIYSSVHLGDKTIENVIERLCTDAHWTSVKRVAFMLCLQESLSRDPSLQPTYHASSYSRFHSVLVGRCQDSTSNLVMPSSFFTFSIHSIIQHYKIWGIKSAVK